MDSSFLSDLQSFNKLNDRPIKRIIVSKRTTPLDEVENQDGTSNNVQVSKTTKSNKLSLNKTEAKQEVKLNSKNKVSSTKDTTSQASSHTIGHTTSQATINSTTPNTTQKPIGNIYTLGSNQPSINIKARLTSDNSAAYHAIENIQPYLYSVLVEKKKRHISFLSNQNITNLEKIYGTPWSKLEFKFSKNKFLNAYDAQDNICLLDDCINDLCMLTLKLVPYNLKNEQGVHKVGLSIKVSKIKKLY